MCHEKYVAMNMSNVKDDQVPFIYNHITTNT